MRHFVLLLVMMIIAAGTASAASAATLTATPTTVSPGAMVTAHWSGVRHPTSTDWVGWYLPSDPAQPGQPQFAWAYDDNCTQAAGSNALSSGSCQLPAPSTAGTYQFRLYAANNDTTLIARSSNVTITSGAPNSCPPEPAGSVTSGGHTWTLEGRDDFNKPAAVGMFGTSDPGALVYTGDQGLSWTEYPDGWPSTFSGSHEGYQPSTVQSVHDGVLDWYLHNDSNGYPVSANPSPLPGGNRDQLYGRYSFCEKIAPADSHQLDDFKQAILLWPLNDSDYKSSESDFPEGNLSQTYFNAFAHYGGAGAQDSFASPTLDTTQWHVYTQEWGPGFRSYYVDGSLIGTTTNQVWASPQRWQLQVEPSGGNDGDSGHVYVDWVAVWSW